MVKPLQTKEMPSCTAELMLTILLILYGCIMIAGVNGDCECLAGKVDLYKFLYIIYLTKLYLLLSCKFSNMQSIRANILYN